MRLTNGQILVLALIPVLVFMISKYLYHSPAGLAATAWVVWREIYSIRLTPLVQVSNSRLLMSDLPTMLLVLIVILCTIKWCHFDNEKNRSLLCGGAIGTAMLLRTQCFVLIPIIWVIFLCSRKPASKKWHSLLFSILGITLVFVPWMIWGRIFPNETANIDTSEGNYLLSLYQKAAGEEDNDSGLAEVILRHPAETIQSVSSHFLNNEISSLLVLPLRLTKTDDADKFFYDEDLFWYRENARETIEQNKLLLFIYMLIISFGVITAVRKNGFAGLIPLLIHITYNLGNAFALTSGFRFILPVDWIILLYFAFGCTAILDFYSRIMLYTSQKAEMKEKDISGRRFRQNSEKNPGLLPAVVFLALVGAILPICDKGIPRHFQQKTSDQIKEEWLAASDSPLNISAYHENEIRYLEGRAFYPRFYKSGEGDSGGSSSAKRGLDFDRLVWMFHDDRVHVLCCPLTDEQTAQIAFSAAPDPMDVIAAGIQHDDYFEVLEMRKIIR